MSDLTWGAACTVVSVLCYGTTYVPVRWFEAADGFYFQWLMSLGMMLVGFVVFLFQGCPLVIPLSMVGGVFFATGNALTVFIMDGVGMAVGSLLWNTVCCISGWAVSRFGLFGTEQIVPYNNWLNIAGVIVVCVGGALFTPIRHHPMKVRPAPWQYLDQIKQPLDNIERNSIHSVHYVTTSKRIFCILLTIIVGFLHGNVLTPINYIVAHKHENGASDQLHTYYFAFSLGAFISATALFALYAMFKRNRPLVNPELTLPAILSGIIYGTAACTFFAANQYLGQIQMLAFIQVIAYPIISKSPGIIISLWAVLLFHEIKGRCNIILLITGILSTLTGVTMISLSKLEL